MMFLMAIDGIGMCGTGGHTIEEMADLKLSSNRSKKNSYSLVSSFYDGKLK
jgi:hypothetical protein